MLPAQVLRHGAVPGVQRRRRRDSDLEHAHPNAEQEVAGPCGLHLRVSAACVCVDCDLRLQDAPSDFVGFLALCFAHEVLVLDHIMSLLV